ITKEEDGQCYASLKWSTKQTGLYASNARIQGVYGLSEMNRKLLEQHGAVGNIIQTSQGASHEEAEESASAELEIPQSDGLDTSFKKDSCRTRSLMAKSEAAKGYQFICSKCSECNECDVAHFVLHGSYNGIDSSDQHHQEESMHVDLAD
ncbi:hypothetical protein BX616_007781, partial [Lobosporangium transversale]